MTNAIAATFSEFRLVKGRKVYQLIFEVPMEKAADALAILGLPNPHAEQWCGIAPLAEKPAAGETTPEQKVGQHPLVQQAGILCADKRFQEWLRYPMGFVVAGSSDMDCAAKVVRRHCGIASRRELATDKEAAAKFEALVSRYRAETGQQAERRP